MSIRYCVPEIAGFLIRELPRRGLTAPAIFLVAFVESLYVAA
jgi:hypothetical protein